MYSCISANRIFPYGILYFIYIEKCKKWCSNALTLVWQSEVLAQCHRAIGNREDIEINPIHSTEFYRILQNTSSCGKTRLANKTKQNSLPCLSAIFCIASLRAQYFSSPRYCLTLGKFADPMLTLVPKSIREPFGGSVSPFLNFPVNIPLSGWS